MKMPNGPHYFDVERLIAHALPWQPFRPGIEVHTLYGELGVSAAAALLRYASGAALPTHEHVGFEHIWVLRGSQSDEHGEYHAGSFVVNRPGTRHSVTSAGGCVVLAVWERPVRFVSI